MLVVEGGGRQAHGFQIGGQEAVAAIQRQHHRRGDHHAVTDTGRSTLQRLAAAPESNAGEQRKTQQGQRQGKGGARHAQTNRLRCKAQTARVRKPPA
ncbi:hypothetical protein D3C85_1264460 [compost metagenome]